MERNQVQWLDLHNRPMKFNRSRILMEVKVTMECFRFKELSAAKQEGSDSPEEIDNAYYLLAVFDTIMNTMAAANGKKVRDKYSLLLNIILLQTNVSAYLT